MIHSSLSLPFAAAFALSVIPSAHAGYPQTVLSNNPVAYYRLEELPGATVAVDSSPNGFDATYVANSGSTSPQLGLPGLTTNSIAVNGGTVGDNGYVLIPYHLELNPMMPDGQHGAAFSVECWVQPNSQPADYSVPLAMFGSYSDPAPFNNASGWNIYQTPGPSSKWIFNLKTVGFFSDPTPITLLKWYHLVFTFDGAAGYFYVNGAAVGSAGGIVNYLANPSHDGQIGAGANVGFLPFSGNLDDVAFYTNALSASQILDHYQVGTNSIRAPLTPPSFVTQPASTTNYHGTTATFTSLAGGTTPITYQWYRGASPIPNATNANYSLPATYPADNGATFHVAVTNVVSGTNSDVVTLTVLTNLNILYPPFGPITRNVGSKAAFRVVANGALPLTYQWFKGSVPIPGATQDTLWLNNVQFADTTNYHAHLTNPFTSADSPTADLVVQARAVTVPITGYSRVVVADDPVAYWRLDETTGTLATDAVGSFDGTYQPNAGTLTFGLLPGIPNETNAAIDVVAGAVVNIPYALELNPVTGPWSFETWIKPDSLDPGNFRTPFSSMWNSDFGGHLFGWNIYQHVAGVWTLNMFNGGGGGSFVSDFVHNPISTSTWYYMVITDDLTTIRYYVNNVLVVTLSRAGFGFIPNGINGDVSVAGAATVLAQRSDNAFAPFFGEIDDTAVYNYALSAQQIQLHYLNSAKVTIAESGNNVVLTWPFGTLQSAPLVTGTYTNVPGATSPRTNAINASQQYYRVQLQP